MSLTEFAFPHFSRRGTPSTSIPTIALKGAFSPYREPISIKNLGSDSPLSAVVAHCAANSAGQGIPHADLQGFLLLVVNHCSTPFRVVFLDAPEDQHNVVYVHYGRYGPRITSKREELKED